MKDKIITFSFVLVLGTFSIYSFILKDKDVSYYERRSLASFPLASIDKIIDGTYFGKLNDYFVDQFPFREDFRTLKGMVSSNIFQKKEDNGVFIKDNNLYQLDANLNEKSILYFTNLLNKVYNDYIKTDNVYYSIVPDKNYYLDDSSIPRLNYEKLFKEVSDNLSDDFQYIDITKELNNSSYYRTDIHWKQEELNLVTKKLASTMGFDFIFPNIKNTYSPFYGALYGRIASDVEPDTITYLTNDNIESLEVYNYEKNRMEKVYQKEYLKHIDSYDVFLSGASPLLVINNLNQSNGKELIVFRDSFGSSIVPLMSEAYSKITVIDLRYLSSSLLGQIEQIEFKSFNQDVLFLYSVPIINNSFSLK